MGADGLAYGDALGDGLGHGLFAPDVLARPQRGERHEAVPVRRGRDVDDVHVRPGDDLAEVTVAAGVRALSQGLLEPFGVHVAHGDRAGPSMRGCPRPMPPTPITARSISLLRLTRPGPPRTRRGTI